MSLCTAWVVFRGYLLELICRYEKSLFTGRSSYLNSGISLINSGTCYCRWVFD